MKTSTNYRIIVASARIELTSQEPKSRVFPLHHEAIKRISINHIKLCSSYIVDEIFS